MLHLFKISFLLILLSCSSLKPQEETKIPEYQSELTIKRILFYGDTIEFERPKSIEPTPNSGKITLIDLRNGNRFGVKHFVSTMITGNESKLVHNVAFYEEAFGEWESLNNPDHREPLVLNEEKEVSIGLTSDGETYFKAEFAYFVSEK